MTLPMKTELRVSRVPLDQIKPAVYNPRVELKPGDPEWEQLARSMDEFGVVEPLVWNQRTGNLVGGHQRFAILKHRGETQFDVSVVDMSPEKEKALNLALNKIEGRWDNSKVLSALSDLMTGGVDLTVTGFAPEEMARMATELDEQLFKPVMPTLESRPEVRQEHVQRAAKQETERFARSAEIKDITCPHCGGVFGLGGDMGELAAKTPGLKVN